MVGGLGGYRRGRRGEDKDIHSNNNNVDENENENENLQGRLNRSEKEDNAERGGKKHRLALKRSPEGLLLKLRLVKTVPWVHAFKLKLTMGSSQF